ncbi:MAG: hypothetical protein K0S61_2436 [Anaerocolumna sp.]|jgi:hypothetical protein|nr:hypothetical protein [Anaerocolumna sp.]
MLNRGIRVLWVKVHIEENKHFHLTLPISLYAFEELLDCVVDLLNVACFFTPKYHQLHHSSVSVHAVRELVIGTIKLLDTLSGTEPYDLVEVEADKVRVSVNIR